MSDSTDSPTGREHYAGHIKVGDAVATPDDALWVVEEIDGEEYRLLSAYHSAKAAWIYADRYEPTRTIVPASFLTKVADARRVRR